MKKFLTSTLETLARLIPPGLYPRLLRRDLIDFFYHAVSDDSMPHVRHLYPVIPVAVFEASLRYLKQNYTFVDYAQLHAHVFEGAPLPPRAVHLSFDDGYVECFTVVRPLLQKFAIPCTFFLTTGLIDNKILFYRNKQSLCIERLNETGSQPFNLPAEVPVFENSATFISWLKGLRLPDEPLIDALCESLGVDWRAFLAERQPYLTISQIQQMQADGFTIAAHTVTHRKLMDLPPQEIESEIAESCRAVAAITGQELVPFSFPHSAFGLDRKLLKAIRSRNPQIGLLFDTKGLRSDATFIHNRIWAEKFPPPLAGEGRAGGGLPKALHVAYQEAWVDEILRRGRKPGRG
jgi:peptidoglycan/xylan/chitin deacetylase (PgdA/CDA1 family)